MKIRDLEQQLDNSYALLLEGKYLLYPHALEHIENKVVFVAHLGDKVQYLWLNISKIGETVPYNKQQVLEAGFPEDIRRIRQG